MICPKCGNNIANDSFFCEYCGTQVRPIKKNHAGKILAIIFGILTLILGITIRSLLVEKNNLLQTQSELYRRIGTTENEKAELEKKLQIWSNYTSMIPFVITNIEIANADKNGNVETDYGHTIYSYNTMYLKPRVKYVGLTSGSKNLSIRLYDANGNLSRGTYNGRPSPADCTYNDDYYINTGENMCVLPGWGHENRGHWKKGLYKIEVWYNNTCLGQKSFSIY